MITIFPRKLLILIVQNTIFHYTVLFPNHIYYEIDDAIVLLEELHKPYSVD
jgi:hypothetical protein